MPHRPERVAESIRDELTEMIEGEMSDPRIGLAAITEIHLDPHLRVAHIFVSVTGSEHEQQESLNGLMAARPLFRRELATRMQLRRIPELRFELDRSETTTARIEELLNRSRRRYRAGDRSQSQAEPPGPGQEE